MSSHITYREAAPGAGVRHNHPAEVAQDKIEVLDGPNGVIKWPASRKKIAICGFAASSRDLAPFDDPSWSIVGMNQLYRHIPRASMWYDLHANWREGNVEGTDHPRWLRESGIPVILAQYEPEIPTCVNYPLQTIIEKVAGVDYFTSSVAFMVAHAIYFFDQQVDDELAQLRDRAREHVEDSGREAREILSDPFALRKWTAERYGERELALYGIDLIVGTEFDFQKACVEFLLGLAQARNITIHLPEACALLKQRWRYGYQSEPDGGIIKQSELKKRQSALTEERDQLMARLRTIDGALQECGYWNDVYDLRIKGGVVKLNE